MACKSPIWIRNRRYFDKKRPRVGMACDDDHKSALALRPWDISRQWLMVPCGMCEDCLRALRNAWFVRLERELARCKVESQQAIFITITINPLHYDAALRDPASFIRKWNERIRHRLGHSFKHAFFQEFGTHPHIGTEPRLHFHGFLFGTNALYSEIRSAVSDLGFVWLSKATLARARYCVKYVTKQISFNPVDVAGKFATIDGNLIPLARLLEHRRYTRKFISPGVGDYLGNRRAPSATVSSWSYLDFKTGCRYDYSIPRYYNRYLSEKDEIIRAVRSADAYARFSKSSLVRRTVNLCVKRFFPTGTLSYRDSYKWQSQQVLKFRPAGSMPHFDPPVWFDFDILSFWKDNYGICIT